MMVTWMQSRMRKRRAFWVTKCTDGPCGPVVVTVFYFFCILHDGYMGRTFTMDSLHAPHWRFGAFTKGWFPISSSTRVSTSITMIIDSIMYSTMSKVCSSTSCNSSHLYTW
jgi:hypothetical protein